MIEKPISIFEIFFYKDPKTLPNRISNLLDKTLSRKDLNSLFLDNGFKISKEWVPQCNESVSREISQGYGTYRIRITNNNHDVADLGIMHGDEEDLMSLLIEFAEHGVPVYGSSELERNF